MTQTSAATQAKIERARSKVLKAIEYFEFFRMKITGVAVADHAGVDRKTADKYIKEYRAKKKEKRLARAG